jgi:hypothetical protein
MRKILAWPIALAASTIVGSLAAACMMPFVALAVVVALSLPIRPALVTVSAIVVANQAIGFTFLGFPAESYTVAWGAALWGATLAAWGIARMVMRPQGDLGAARLLLAGAAAFGTYEALLYSFATQVGGLETFTPAIIVQVALNEGLWLITLVALRLALTGVAPAVFGAQPRLRLA